MFGLPLLSVGKTARMRGTVFFWLFRFWSHFPQPSRCPKEGIARLAPVWHLPGMTFTWYGNQSPAEGCNLGALAMLRPLLEKMQLAPIINRHLPADPQAEFDHGQVLRLLAAARRNALTRRAFPGSGRGGENKPQSH
jgi:hypothetical protein